MNHPQPEFSLERIEIAVSMQQQVFIPDTKRSDRAIHPLCKNLIFMCTTQRMIRLLSQRNLA
jgi:hypothetical protein